MDRELPKVTTQPGAEAIVALFLIKSSSDEAWAELVELVVRADNEPSHENVKAALDAEYELTGDCKAVGHIANATGYDDERIGQ